MGAVITFPRLGLFTVLNTVVLVVAAGAALAAAHGGQALGIADAEDLVLATESCDDLASCAEAGEDLPPGRVVLLQRAFNTGDSRRNLASKGGAAEASLARKHKAAASSSTDADTAGTHRTPEKVRELKAEENKRTDAVHEQAYVVANASTDLREAKRWEKMTSSSFRDLKQASVVADEHAQDANDAAFNFSIGQAARKKKRDDTEDALKKARAQFDKLKAKNRTIFEEYDQLSSSLPEAKEQLGTALQREKAAAEKLNNSRLLSKTAQNMVKQREDELQLAIAELNRRNGKLKNVELRVAANREQ